RRPLRRRGRHDTGARGRHQCYSRRIVGVRRPPCRDAGDPGTGVARDPREQIQRREVSMARIKHIALTTSDPAKAAAFYKEAFGLKEVRRSPRGAVFLTDGYIN